MAETVLRPPDLTLPMEAAALAAVIGRRARFDPIPQPPTPDRLRACVKALLRPL